MGGGAGRVSSPPKGKLDPGRDWRIYFGKEWELLHPLSRKGSRKLGQVPPFFKQSPNTQQFVSVGVNKRRSREMYYGFKNTCILHVFLRLPGKTRQNN